MLARLDSMYILRLKNELSWEISMRLILAGIGIAAYADVPIGIIGGQTSDSNGYAAFVFSNGSQTPVVTPTSEINGVAMNGAGLGLIGGQADSASGYAAFVSLNGGIVPLSLSLPGGTIMATAINQSGTGLIGGENGDGPQYGYAAMVLPDGTVSPLTFPLDFSGDFIDTVALNDAGIGLIGGEGTTIPFAAYVIDGAATPVSNTPESAGRVYSVAVNDLGNGIIGGTGEGDFIAYAAFVTPDGGASAVFTGIPTGGGQVLSVAINHSGMGLTGGEDASGNVFAGYASPTPGGGTVTPLFNSPFTGTVYSVAMNDAGTGLIGGENNSNLYAAFVQPSGSISSLISEEIPGQINWVAINDAGVGLVGGQQGSAGYAALAAPNGALTLLDVSDEATINTVALSNVLNATTPQSTGPFLSVAYTQLAAVSALEPRLIGKNRNWPQTRADIAQNELLASNEADLAPGKTAQSIRPNSIWIAPFGDWVYLKAQGAIPSYSNEIGGALIGYDRQLSNCLIGVCFGYAFNYIAYSQSLGHGKVQEEMASLYGAYYGDHFRFNAVLWGGLYQLWNVRHTLPLITSRSKTSGWILDPHIELATPWAFDQKDRYVVEPFFMIDWVNSWQNRFTESGSAGFNLKVGNLYGSLLQSEVGCRFYERFEQRWGNICLEEKLSYVNQAPFYVNAATTAFVGSASTFPIAVASTRVENLAAFQLNASFFPKNSSYPYVGFVGEATANSSYQSYFVSLFGGIGF